MRLKSNISTTLIQTLIFLCFVLYIIPASGQKAVKELRTGNKNYEKGDYKSAEINYRKALEQKNNYTKALFNLGDALYKLNKYEEAEKIFQNLAATDIPKDLAAKVYHNLGNSLLAQKKYKESIEAYKNALKLHPKDVDTKYNLEYAKKMLQQQQQQQNQQQQNQQQQQQQQNQQQQQQNKDNQNQPKKQDQISKQDAERMLNALLNKEKNLREKMDKEKENQKIEKYKTDKDW